MVVSAGLSCYSSLHPRTRSRQIGSPPMTPPLRQILHENYRVRLPLYVGFPRQ